MNSNQLQHQVLYMRRSLFDQFESQESYLCWENMCLPVRAETFNLGCGTVLKVPLIVVGYLDSEQFIQLEDLQDDANPNFVEEVVSLFYSDSARLIQNIEQTLSNRPVNFSRLDDILHQFKGSCSSIGAKKVKDACSQFREYCNAGNAEGSSRSFQLIKQEYEILRRRLESYFQMAKQAKAA